MAVAARTPGDGEDGVLVVVVVDKPDFLQAFGDQPRLFMFGLKGVHHAQPHQIGQLDLQRHGAAIGLTAVTQPGFVAGPGVQPVNVNDVNG